MAEDISKFFAGAKDKFVKRCTMDSLLKQARKSLEKYLDPKIVPFEQRFSREMLINAEGIVFLTEAKAGFMFGLKGGTGVIICRTSTNQWSAPISIGTAGASFGFQAGLSKVDHIIILPSRNHVKTFLGKGQLQIKGNAEAAIAQYGRDLNLGVGIGNSRAAPVVSYSFGVKGLYGGVSIDGTVLIPRNDCIQEFYGKKVSLDDIADGNIEAPSMNENYSRIVELLDLYTAEFSVQSILEGHTMNPDDMKSKLNSEVKQDLAQFDASK